MILFLPTPPIYAKILLFYTVLNANLHTQTAQQYNQSIRGLYLGKPPQHTHNMQI
jgi:hypothetical protein